MNRRLTVILAVLLGLCLLLFGLTACDKLEDPVGNNHTKIYGIEATVFDENNNVIHTISSVTDNECKMLTFYASKRYIIEVDLVQWGGSAVAVILADSVIWSYDSELLTIEKCNDDETDTSYYIVCNNTNKTADLGIQVGEFSLELNVCLEE